LQRRVPRSNVNGWGLGSMCAIFVLYWVSSIPV
jgi:hypothetical protein